MTVKQTTPMTFVAGVSTAAVAQVDQAAVNQALETLKTYDWGDDRKTLDPIDRAVIATRGDAAARKALEKNLVSLLASGISRSAVDFVCRRLRVIGTAQSVEVLAALLPSEKTSHIARYALERIPDEKAVAALRAALPKVDSKLKSGIIGSLGTLRDKKSIQAISENLGASDIMLARAAAQSLGLIGTTAAAKELAAFAGKASGEMKMRVADARLICAEQMLTDGNKAEALAVYAELKGNDQPTYIKLAAMKGTLAANNQN